MGGGGLVGDIGARGSPSLQFLFWEYIIMSALTRNMPDNC